MSSDKTCENHVRRMPKVSYGRFVRVGLVGPKSRAKAVDDGQRVNIPVPLGGSYGGTQNGKPARYWIRVPSP
jgi:hypothetical protein